MNVDEMDFQKELSINKYKLDEECLSHASKYAYWSEAYIIARNDYGVKKDNLTYLISSKSIALRNFYMESGEKFTEGRLSSAIDIDDEIVEARKELREAEDLMNKMDIAVKAMEVRKSELDNLVKLYCSGYFSNVSTTPNYRDAQNEVSRDIRKNLNKVEDEDYD